MQRRDFLSSVTLLTLIQAPNHLFGPSVRESRADDGQTGKDIRIFWIDESDKFDDAPNPEMNYAIKLPGDIRRNEWDPIFPQDLISLRAAKFRLGKSGWDKHRNSGAVTFRIHLVKYIPLEDVPAFVSAAPISHIDKSIKFVDRPRMSTAFSRVPLFRGVEGSYLRASDGLTFRYEVGVYRSTEVHRSDWWQLIDRLIDEGANVGLTAHVLFSVSMKIFGAAKRIFMKEAKVGEMWPVREAGTFPFVKYGRYVFTNLKGQLQDIKRLYVYKVDHLEHAFSHKEAEADQLYLDIGRTSP